MIFSDPDPDSTYKFISDPDTDPCPVLNLGRFFSTYTNLAQHLITFVGRLVRVLLFRIVKYL